MWRSDVAGRLTALTLLLICAAPIASCATISATVTVRNSDYFQAFLDYAPMPSCSASVTFSGDPVSFSTDNSICPQIPFRELLVSGMLGDMSGRIFSSCDPGQGPLLCTGGFSVEGDYYFAGSGMKTFTFGSFYDPGIAWLEVDSFLEIDGQPIRVQPVPWGPFSPMVTLQLGEVHHLTYDGGFFASEDGPLSYSFESPGVPIWSVTEAAPEPECWWLVLSGAYAIGAYRQRKEAPDVRST